MSTTRDIGAPTLNLNGTSRAELLQLQLNAGDAIHAAVAACRKAHPNGRDYLTPEALDAAQRAHNRRIAALLALLAEYNQLATAIDEQRGGR